MPITCRSASATTMVADGRKSRLAEPVGVRALLVGIDRIAHQDADGGVDIGQAGAADVILHGSLSGAKRSAWAADVPEEGYHAHLLRCGEGRPYDAPHSLLSWRARAYPSHWRITGCGISCVGAPSRRPCSSSSPRVRPRGAGHRARALPKALREAPRPARTLPRYVQRMRLGCVEIPSGEPIHIVFWGVLSGADSTLGEDSKRGVEIAIDDIGKKLLGHDIELTTEDGLCTPEGGATAAQKIAADTTIAGLIGPNCTDEVLGGIEAITDAGMTTISSSATRAGLTVPDRGPEACRLPAHRPQRLLPGSDGR